MKNIKSKLLVAQLALCLIINLLGCSQNKVEPDETIQNQRIWIMSDFEKYEKLMKERAEFNSGTYFDILDIKRTNNKLKITVEGGCNTAAYKVYWDGKLDFKKPLIANLLIAYESEIDIKCVKTEKYTIDVDLIRLIGKEYETSMQVKISNSTKVSDIMIDRDGKVTTTN
jgi:hypothetical protein